MTKRCEIGLSVITINSANVKKQNKTKSYGVPIVQQFCREPTMNTIKRDLVGN